MLTSYTPAAGPKAGVALTLPLITADERSIQFSTGAVQPVAEGWGSVIGSGQSALFPSGGLIKATLTLTPNALIARGYSGTLAGLETAKYDLAMYLMQGGTGTLLETLPTGTTAGKGGATLTSRTIPSIIQNNPTGKSDSPYIDVWDLQVEFFCPTCFWLNSDGSYTFMGAL